MPNETKRSQFRSRLLQRRAAATAGVTLNKIYDVYMKPDGRVEGDSKDIMQTLERGNETLRRAAISSRFPRS